MYVRLPSSLPVVNIPHLCLCPDVAEDNVIPIAQLIAKKDPEFSTHVGQSADHILRVLVEGFPGLGRHFLKPLEGPAGRIIFVPHPETLARFPGDAAKAEAYLKYGHLQ